MAPSTAVHAPFRTKVSSLCLLFCVGSREIRNWRGMNPFYNIRVPSLLFLGVGIWIFVFCFTLPVSRMDPVTRAFRIYAPVNSSISHHPTTIRGLLAAVTFPTVSYVPVLAYLLHLTTNTTFGYVIPSIKHYTTPYRLYHLPFRRIIKPLHILPCIFVLLHHLLPRQFSYLCSTYAR